MEPAVQPLFGPLPSYWRVTTLGEVCAEGGGDIQTGPFGSQLHASDYVTIGIPSIMPQNIGDNRVVTNGIARITIKDAQRLARYRVRPGDIVYSRRGDVERRALIRLEEDGWLCGTGCLRVRLGGDIVDPLYCFYYLGHPAVRAWIVRHAIGATMPNLNTSILAALPVVVPPLPEQRAIAAMLGALDDKIELNRRMNTTLEAMARAIFTSWFVDFDPVRAKMEGRQPAGMDADTAALFPDALEDSSLGRIPQGWANVHFAALADLSRISLNPANFAQEVFDHYSIPAYDNGQVPAQDKGESILSTKFLVPENCVLLSKLNPRFPRVWLPNQDSRRRAIASTEFLVLLPKLPVSREFLYSLCSSQDFAERFATSVTGTSGSHQRVRPDDLLAMNVALAPESVLRAFTRLSDPILHQIQVNQQESLTLGAARDALLPKLLSGEIRVGEAQKTVETVL